MKQAFSTLTSKMAKHHKLRICFFDKSVPSSMSNTAITLRFKLPWFSDEAGCSAEKVYTDINSPPLMSNEDKKFGGSLVLDLRK